jgi:mono/diheme cytochrome c family protein
MLRNKMSPSSKRCVLGVALLFTVTVFAQQPQTVGQGVYTPAQANRGQAIYKEQCASCHGDTLGGGLGPPLTGDDFIEAWGKQPVSDLFAKVKNTMPRDSAGKLTAQQAADLLAYMLQVGKFPTGRAELPTDEAALKQITLPGNAVQSKTATAGTQAPSFPPAGNLAQVMRGILFPSSNIIFTVQTHDPAEKRTAADGAAADGGFNFVTWGGGIYSGWELVDYAAVALAESAPLMLTPGRRCENGKPVPVNDADWLKFTNELAEAGKAAYKASQSRNQEAVSDISNQVSESCQHCHQVYRDKPGRGGNPLDQSSRALRCVK